MGNGNNPQPPPPGGFEEEDGKHFEIGVREWAPGMTSYLRLGAPSLSAGDPSARSEGEDLASLVNGFVDDTRDRGDAKTPPLGIDGDPVIGHVFGPRPPGLPPPLIQAAPHGVPPAPPETALGGSAQPLDSDGRRRESSVLHKRGGWRDHSDGNRITTTRGDKVEVIRGNYKLVVLGRGDLDSAMAETDLDARRKKKQKLLDNASGFDWSGGQADPGDLSFGMDPDSEVAPTRDRTHLELDYRWAQDSDGKWSWTQTTTLGTEDIDLSDPTQAGNYRVINNNFVDYQEDNYGSETKRVDIVSSNTWCRHQWSMTDVSEVSDTHVKAAILNTITTADTLWNDLTVAPLKQETVITGAMNEVDIATTAIGLAQIGTLNITNLLLSPLVTNATIASAQLMDLTITPAHVEVTTGMHTEATAGLHTELHGGPHFELHAGPHLQWNAQDGNVYLEGGGSGPVSMCPLGEHAISAQQTALLTSALQIAMIHHFM